MKRLLAALLLATAAAAACGESANPPPAAVPSATPSPGMTLDQEVGAVIMSGFRGPISDSVVADWRSHRSRAQEHHLDAARSLRAWAHRSDRSGGGRRVPGRRVGAMRAHAGRPG